MKRPLAVVGFTYVAVCAFAAALPPRINASVAVAAGICGLMALLSRHRARMAAACILLAVGCGCAALFLSYELRTLPALAEADTISEIAGTVTEVSSARSIKVRRADGVQVAVSAREPLDVLPGEHFSAVVRLTRYEEGSLSPSAALNARQTPLRGFVLADYSAQEPQNGTMKGLLFHMRRGLAEVLMDTAPGDGGLTLCGMLLGRMDLIPAGVQDAYRAAGLSHLLVVSGYHVALIAAFAALPWHFTRRRAWLRAFGCCAAIVCYMALVGFTPSVLRAGTMVVLALCGTALEREPDSLTSLSAAGLIICVMDPFAAAQTSFCLSFLATLGIVLYAKPLQEKLEQRLGAARFPKARSFAVGALCVTLCANAATLPVMLLRFQLVPVYSAPANLLVAPLVPVVMLLGLITSLLGSIPGISLLAIPFGAAAGFFTNLLNAAAGAIARLPLARLPAGAGFLPLWMLGAGLMLAVALVCPSRKKTAACAALCAITLMVGVFSYQLVTRGAVRLTVVATERSAVLLAVKDGRAALIGDIRTRSDAYAVEQVLERYFIRSLDLVALTPGSGTRNGAVGALLAQYPVELAVLGGEDLEDARLAPALTNARIEVWREGVEITLLGADSVYLANGGIFTEFEGIKAFILSGECDILDNILVHGRPDVAILAGARPVGSERLRCRWLVDCAGEGLGSAAKETALLREPGRDASFLLREGKARLLGTSGEIQ